MNLERLIEALGCEWRTADEMDAHIARLLGVPEWDTLSGQTHRYSLQSFGVLESDGTGQRLRKRPGYSVPPKADWAEIENRRLREVQAREEAEHRQRELNQEAERNPRWQAERAVIVQVVDERLRELGLISDTPAMGAGERQ